MKKNQKVRIFLTLIISSFVLLSCAKAESKKAAMPKPHGTRQEKIAYHKKEIQKYQAQIEREQRTSLRALSRQDMESAREAQDCKRQYQKKIDKHTQKIHELRGEDENW